MAKSHLQEIAEWGSTRGGDGAGGKGTVEQGSAVFADQCAARHGTFGEGEGRFPKRVSGAGDPSGRPAEADDRQLLAVCADIVGLH
jgi:cytochrome c